jgi:hypothetical protein
VRVLARICSDELESRPRAPQIGLFHSLPQSPAWPQLPREIRQQTVELLAQLLREHYRRIASGQLGKEREHE